MNKCERFKTMEEMSNNISRGGEIEFSYKNKNYSIIPIENNFLITEAYNEATEKIYENPEEVGEYTIQGKKLKEILDDIEITFRCF